jgi:hypothetical protein
MRRKRAATFTVILCLLNTCGISQTLKNDIVKIRIESLSPDAHYHPGSSIPIRCRFKNTSAKSTTITLPNDEPLVTFPKSSPRFEVTLSQLGQKQNYLDVRGHFLMSNFCRTVSVPLDSATTCESPGTSTRFVLRANEEIVRVIPMRFFLGSLKEIEQEIPPGKYRIRVTSEQDDSTLVSNELTIVIDPSGSAESY